MVSIDHFRQELLAQMDRAATLGRIDILINSRELCRSIPNGKSHDGFRCHAGRPSKRNRRARAIAC
jgi:hypothetical protein